LRQLTTNRNNDTSGFFKLIDIHHSLVAQLLKVKFIGRIEISAVLLTS
jgi:hypothetical protein